jgi:hypothetical protein
MAIFNAVLRPMFRQIRGFSGCGCPPTPEPAEVSKFLTNEYLFADRRRLATAFERALPYPFPYKYLGVHDNSGEPAIETWDPALYPSLSSEYKCLIETFRNNERFCSTLPFIRTIEDDRVAGETFAGVASKLYLPKPGPSYASNRDTFIERSFVYYGFFDRTIETVESIPLHMLEMRGEEIPGEKETMIEFTNPWIPEDHPELSTVEKFIVDVFRDNDRFVATYQMVGVKDGPSPAAHDFVYWAQKLFGPV